jgi:hypothetical protein
VWLLNIRRVHRSRLPDIGVIAGLAVVAFEPAAPRGYDYEVAYWQGTGQGRLAELWGEAMAFAPAGLFPASFYRDEWELVVQPGGCERWEAYKGACSALARALGFRAVAGSARLR